MSCFKAPINPCVWTFIQATSVSMKDLSTYGNGHKGSGWVYNAEICVGGLRCMCMVLIVGNGVKSKKLGQLSELFALE